MTNLDDINFRYLDHSFLLVKDIDDKTKGTIKASGYHIRHDDNAMLVYGYIDHEVGLSFEFLCAACVFDDGSVALEPGDNTRSFKFRYGAFTGDVEQFNDNDKAAPFEEWVERFDKYYGCNDRVNDIRDITELDSLRAPGFPDDILVLFIKEGVRTEGIWCRVEDSDPDTGKIKAKMLNHPYSDFGKSIGDIVNVILYRMDDGELKAVAVL